MDFPGTSGSATGPPRKARFTFRSGPTTSTLRGAAILYIICGERAGRTVPRRAFRPVGPEKLELPSGDGIVADIDAADAAVFPRTPIHLYSCHIFVVRAHRGPS